MLRFLRSICKSPVCRWVIAVLLFVGILMTKQTTFTEFLEFKLYDLKFRYRGARAPGPEVVIVGIDDDSIKAVGRWPWSREDTTRLILKVKEGKPRVVAMDVIFAEKQETAALHSLTNLGREISRLPVSREVVDLVEREKHKVDVDRHLAEAIKLKPPTILGFFFREVGGKTGGVKAEQLMERSFIQAATYNLVRSLDATPSQVPIMGAKGVEVNLPEISRAAANNGYFNMLPDPDGVVRWFAMSILYGSDIFAPLVLATTSRYQGGVPMGITLSQLGVEEIRLGRTQVPVDRYGRLLINYLGPPGMIPTYSARAVMDGSLPPDTLKDKIVLIGATAMGIYDLRVTPFAGIFPGVEIQATVMDNLLHGNFLRTPRFSLPIMLVVLLGLGLLMGLSLPRLSAVWAFLFTLILIEGYVVLNYLFFRHQGLQVPLFYPLMEIVMIYLGITVHSFLTEERERERVKKAFESYVAPAVVQEMLKHPEQLRLGGERREITILFSDIRGFTTMSEDLAPDELVRLLHDFLNPMSNIIINQGGTIDKYMGDAIMAEFGAPLAQPDHPKLACRAALEMTATLEALNQEWVAQGRRPLQIGIGVNTGPAAVGNMGSDRLFDYTAIGDNVNLASRLEGLTKHYNTSIIINESTATALENGFILRELDRVRVKGKAQAAAIFEVLGEGEPDPALARFLEHYHQGLAAYREQRWAASLAAFQEALALRPEDASTKRYLAQALNYQKNPPEPGWEAVTVMDAK